MRSYVIDIVWSVIDTQSTKSFAGHYFASIPSAFSWRCPDGQALAYFYYEDEPARRSVDKLLTRGGGHAMDSARNSLRQERKAK